MIQIAKQSHKEKMTMYMKLEKRSLAEMLIESSELVNNLITRTNKVYYVDYIEYNEALPCEVKSKVITFTSTEDITLAKIQTAVKLKYTDTITSITKL